jgi:endonuclease/exonuclease/phosphatase family metal-dependent hydrolase
MNATFRRLLAVLALVAAGPVSAETALSVMTFNIRYGTANDGPNAWELRRDIVVDTIEQYAPDILGLQECLKFQADYLAAHLPEYDHFGVGRESDGSGERMEIFYRPEVLVPIESGHFWLSETPDVPGSRSWDSANVRMASWAKFHVFGSGQRLMYLNSHFDHRSRDARVEAANMLASWAEDQARRLPVIITADFNATAEQSLPWEILTVPLRDAWMATSERVGPAITWSGFKAPTEEVRRIDWILVSDDIAVTKCETITYSDSGRFPSDHFPVVAQILVPEAH